MSEQTPVDQDRDATVAELQQRAAADYAAAVAARRAEAARLAEEGRR